MNESFYNEQAEKSILALLLSDTGNWKYITQLSGTDFCQPQHRQIFEAMQRMYAEGKPIDLVTLSDRMHAMYGHAEAELTQLLVNISLEHSFGGSWALQGHIEIVRSAAMRRQFVEILDNARREVMDESNDTSAVLDRTRQNLRDIVATKYEWKSISDVLIATFNMLERRCRGEEPAMPSGISSLDLTTTGFHRGEVTIIGARPAVGKSALGAHIALCTASQGYKVGICSREMTDVQYGSRIITRHTDIDNNKLRSGDLDNDDWGKITNTMLLYNDVDVSFMFSTRYVEDLRMEVQKKVDSGKLDMLVIDYIQLMQTKQKFDKDYLRIAYISKMIKDMSVDFNIAILSLAQVGRASEGTMPTLSDLRGSGDLEQDADNIIFMHRPADPSDKFVRPSDRALFEELRFQGKQYIALNIAKQRQGKTGTVAVVFDPERMRFTAIDRRE